MKLKTTLEIEDGKVCVRRPIIHHREPRVTWLWWPTTESAADIMATRPKWIGRELDDRGQYDGKFTIRAGEGPFSGWATITLRNGPKTEPIREVTEDLPRPRTRLEVRWDYANERWEKKTKRGWVTA